MKDGKFVALPPNLPIGSQGSRDDRRLPLQDRPLVGAAPDPPRLKSQASCACLTKHWSSSAPFPPPEVRVAALGPQGDRL